MKTLIKASLLFVSISISGLSLFAQEGSNNEDTDKKSDDIIIHKKGDSKEKTTIVIDGDKVTINGKPVDEYKSDDLDIIRGDNDMPFMAYAPMPPHGNFNGNLLGDDFMSEVRSNKAFLGVMTKKVDGGAQITEIPEKESAAEKAGLKVGDVITKVDEDKIEDADDLYKAIGKYKAGDKITIAYKRDGKENSTTATLGENKQVRVFSWKNGDGNNNDFKFDFAPRVTPRIEGWGGGDHEWAWADKPRLGIQVQDTEDGKGVKVLDVEDDEAADKAGVKEDDIITAVNGKNITSVDDLKSAVKDAKSGDTIKLDILRDGKSQTVNVKFPKELKTTDL